MLAVYTFVFSVVFQARWGTATIGPKAEFALLLFAGLIVFNAFSEILSRAPTAVSSNPSYVKKVVFPLECLDLALLCSTMIQMLISLTVWLSAYVAFVGIPHATILFLPLAMIPYALFLAGIAWILSSLGVFIRDTPQVTAVIISVTMFLSPLFYPVDALPKQYQQLLLLNPLAVYMQSFRDLLYFGRLPQPASFILNLLVAGLVAVLGFAWFQKTRKGFADVL